MTWHSAPGVSSSSVPGLNIPMMRVTGAQEYNKTMTASNPVPVIRTPGVLNIKSANGKSCGPINSMVLFLSKLQNTHRDYSRTKQFCCWLMFFMANVSAGSVIVWGVPHGLSPLFPLDNWSQGSQKQQNRFILKQKTNSLHILSDVSGYQSRFKKGSGSILNTFAHWTLFNAWALE